MPIPCQALFTPKGVISIMYGFVYITTNLINGKQYIGQHKGDGNDDYLGSGDRLIMAIKKYGKENFKREILEFADSLEDLNELERYYIALADAVNNNNYYNIAHGGHVNPHYGTDNGMHRSNIPKEKRQEINEKLKKSRRNNEKLKEYHKSQEFKKKMSEVTKGKKNPMTGKKHTDESKKKMSENRKGKAVGKENGNYGNHKGKTVYQWEDKDMTILIKEHESMETALKSLGLIGHTQMMNAIRNKTLYKGYYWSR